jgi:hypothetical protein
MNRLAAQVSKIFMEKKHTSLDFIDVYAILFSVFF